MYYYKKQQANIGYSIIKKDNKTNNLYLLKCFTTHYEDLFIMQIIYILCKD